MVAQDEALFCLMAERESIHWDADGFQLSSGLVSVCKADFGRGDVMESPGYLRMLGEKVLDILETSGMLNMGKQICLIGVPTAGMPLAQAASEIHYYHTGTDDVVFRILRPFVDVDPNDSDRRLWTHDEPSDEQHYVLVENVGTTAGNLLSAHSKLREQGYPARDISALLVVDRELSAKRRLWKEARIPKSRVAVGWKITELIARMQSFGFMPDLPSNAVEILQQEIAQFHESPPF